MIVSLLFVTIDAPDIQIFNVTSVKNLKIVFS